MTMTNQQRADAARLALDAFMQGTGQTDAWEALGDLLGDFMHLVDYEVYGLGNGDLSKSDPFADAAFAFNTADVTDTDHPGAELLQQAFDRGVGYYTEEVDEDD